MAKSKPKTATGRPKIVWDDEKYNIFEGLCAIQCTLTEMCGVLGVSDKTLYRLCLDHYKDDDGNPMPYSEVYKKYSEGGKASLRRYQFSLAKKNATMAIWLGKQYLGQKDHIEQQTESQGVVINVRAATTADVEDNE